VFDGVHKGHQQLIGTAVDRARAANLPTVVLTFDPHPSDVVRPGSHPARLTTVDRKAELLAKLGVDVMCVLPFTLEFSRLGPDEFVHEVLVEHLHTATLVVGENFVFGHKAAGNVGLLRELGARFGFSVDALPIVGDGTDHVRFSSTYVRSCIDAGDVTAAAAALGRPHRLEGIVMRGTGKARELGYPTANLHTEPYSAIPADGVYASYAIVGDKRFPAATSVGNPMFHGENRTVEAYLMDFDDDLYGHQIAVDFVQRLRGMARFDGLDPLIEQMGRDVAQARDLLR
jgi:riboflavin kinase/FMN adenylyltransferase